MEFDLYFSNMDSDVADLDLIPKDRQKTMLQPNHYLRAPVGPGEGPHCSSYDRGASHVFGGSEIIRQLDYTSTLLGTNISPTKALLKMMFLFPRWDILVFWRLSSSSIYYLLYNLSTTGATCEPRLGTATLHRLISICDAC